VSRARESRDADASPPERHDGPADARPDRSELVTGTLGSPGGARRRLAARLAARLADRVLDAQLARHAARLDDLAATAPERDVLVVSVYRGDGDMLPAALAELGRTRHRVRVALGSMDAAVPALAESTVATSLAGGKYDNVNAILAAAGPAADWTLVVDDDVALPERFLDRLVGIAEHHDLALAQPAQSLTSHAAWQIGRAHV
jgi:hypothetical protein